jgi:hypothetical protein
MSLRSPRSEIGQELGLITPSHGENRGFESPRERQQGAADHSPETAAWLAPNTRVRPLRLEVAPTGKFHRRAVAIIYPPFG